MHIHICPTEIAIAMMIWDAVQMYAFHYKHILFSFIWKDKDCEVCNDN